MKIATVDLETYWAVGHSLTKMSPIAYCMHPDTEIISCALKLDDGPTVVVFGEHATRDILNDVDWSEYMLIGHNMSGFDAMILAWRFGIKPRLWGCTLAMARPVHAKDVELKLGALVRHYKLGVKDQSVLMQTKGRNLCDFTEQEIEDMRMYNAADVDQCYQLFSRLIAHTSPDELRLIDMTIRMLVEPQFSADINLLFNTLIDEEERKEKLLAEAARKMNLWDEFMDASEAAEKALTVLSSAAKFATFLETVGVEVPTKISLRTGKEIPALAKTDEAFLELQNHHDPLVATVAAARLDAKSTILRTRIQAFINAAQAHPDKRVPIPLKYYGADTTGRWSGWGYNPQNLPSINPNNPRPSDALRRCLIAPQGHKVVVADLAGIELRVNHFLWKVPSSMTLFESDPDKADLYIQFARQLYNVGPEVPDWEFKSGKHKSKRQVGKAAHLGLGFQAGAETFQKFAKTVGGVALTEKESQKIVSRWRSDYSEIKKGWDQCRDSIPTMMNGLEGKCVDPWGMVTPTPTGLATPKGYIRYPNLRKYYNEEFDKNEIVYGNKRATLYGGKMVENIVQHLARCVIADNALAVRRRTGLNPALMVHDELVYVVPAAQAQSTLDDVQEIMRTPPDWWPELITWSEGSIADNYGAAK